MKSGTGSALTHCRTELRLNVLPSPPVIAAGARAVRPEKWFTVTTGKLPGRNSAQWRNVVASLEVITLSAEIDFFPVYLIDVNYVKKISTKT